MYHLTVEFRDKLRFPESYTVDDEHVPDLASFDEGDNALVICTVDESVIQFHKHDVFAVYAHVVDGDEA